MRLIAFAGQARCGKTTFARAFAAAGFDMGFSPVIRSFAGPLKQAAAEQGFTKEERPEEYREFCQIVGAVKRAQNPNHWLELFEAELMQLAASDALALTQAMSNGGEYHETLVLIDDLRYENEHELVARWGGQNVLILREDLPEADAAWRDHESEEFCNYWTTADQDSQNEMFNVIFVNDVSSEAEIERASKTLLSLTVMEALIGGPSPMEEQTLGSSMDDLEEALDELRRLARDLKDECDRQNGIELEEDEDDDDEH